MKKLSYELMKSYRNLIILFSISYMITMLFFSSYIKNAAYLDIEVINGFINYEMNGIEEKLKKGENFEEILQLIIPYNQNIFMNFFTEIYSDFSMEHDMNSQLFTYCNLQLYSNNIPINNNTTKKKNKL